LESLMNKTAASNGVLLLDSASSSDLVSSEGSNAFSEAEARKQKNAWKGGGNISGHFAGPKAAEGSATTADASNPGAHSNKGTDTKKKSKEEADPNPVRASDCRFIVNVSSMEGKFYRRKLATHPHTNMAKAALNMLTRTSASEYQKYSIYMTAVDTGWINDENPIERAARTAETHNFATPLDEIDAAARILDPIFAPLLKAQSERRPGAPGDEESEQVHVSASNDGLCAPPFGCFLKDYFPTEW
jgi:NAD(P)-dependent dehydrogenase (short-subunit alcohol dehydrogenase family)